MPKKEEGKEELHIQDLSKKKRLILPAIQKPFNSYIEADYEEMEERVNTHAIKD